MVVHGGLIALRVREYWRGVLIDGPSGAGKSDLALRALEVGFRLVADDRVILWVSEKRLFGRAPDTLAEKLELHGFDVVAVPALTLSEVALVVQCGSSERIPELTREFLLGVAIPHVQIDLRLASAPAGLRRALCHFDEAAKRRI